MNTSCKSHINSRIYSIWTVVQDKNILEGPQSSAMTDVGHYSIYIKHAIALAGLLFDYSTRGM